MSRPLDLDTQLAGWAEAGTKTPFGPSAQSTSGAGSSKDTVGCELVPRATLIDKDNEEEPQYKAEQQRLDVAQEESHTMKQESCEEPTVEPSLSEVVLMLNGRSRF